MTRKHPDPAEFDRYAGDYDSLLRDPIRDRFASEKIFFVERKLDIILRFLRARNIDTHTMTWLDVGCGRGELLRLGAPHFRRVSGCDPSVRMLEACRDLDVCHQPSMNALPFSDESFDLISVVCVYHHVAEAERATLTAELVRALRPGGILCVIEHNPFNPVTRIIVSRTPVDADARLLVPSLTRRLLSSAGLQPIATRYFLLLPERLFKPFAIVEHALRAVPVAGQYAAFAQRSR